MGLYTTDSIERVKDAVDMVELVGGRTDLRRVGSRHQGLCPFHDERTPSFSVDADRKLYHCFGCGASGDAITFVRELEALDFAGAVEWLADRYGVELQREQEDPRAEEQRRRRERLLALVERAAGFYERCLWESPESAPAREYLAARGLGEEVLREFRVGYAPQAGDRLVRAATRGGGGAQELIAAGLAQPGRSGGPIDRFRGRIVFPLADARGRVRGFGARALHDGQRPKYLNSSENELYRKGRQLFGLDRARAAAARAGRVVVVEGYTDVLALHQAGMREAVAIMGTALTDEQLSELTRAAPAIYLALDADAAGRGAMLRAAHSAEQRGAELWVVPMPDGTDPAELVAERGVDGFAKLIASPLSVPEFEARQIVAGADLSNAPGRDRALAELRPLVASLGPSAVRDRLVRDAANRLGVPDSYLLTQVAASGPVPVPARAASPANGNGARGPARRADGLRLDLVQSAERAFLAMCLRERRVGRDYLGRLDDGHLSSDALRRVRAWLLEHYEDPLAQLPADDAVLRSAVTELHFRAENEPSSPALLRTGFLELERRRLKRQLSHAEQEGNLERQRELQRTLFALESEYEKAYRETE